MNWQTIPLFLAELRTLLSFIYSYYLFLPNTAAFRRHQKIAADPLYVWSVSRPSFALDRCSRHTDPVKDERASFESRHPSYEPTDAESPRFQRSSGFFQRYSGLDPEYNQSQETAVVSPKLVCELA